MEILIGSVVALIAAVVLKLLVRRVVGEKDFGGTWTCDIAPSPGGSTLTIDGTIAALRKRFGEA